MGGIFFLFLKIVSFFRRLIIIYAAVLFLDRFVSNIDLFCILSLDKLRNKKSVSVVEQSVGTKIFFLYFIIGVTFDLKNRPLYYLI